jgi:hypothetical protein
MGLTWDLRLGGQWFLLNEQRNIIAYLVPKHSSNTPFKKPTGWRFYVRTRNFSRSNDVFVKEYSSTENRPDTVMKMVQEAFE